LLGCGLAIGLFATVTALEGVVWQWYGNRQFQPVSAASSLQSGVAGTPRTSLDAFKPPERGALIARLEVPRLKLSTVILEGSDDAILKKGPGHIEETAYPGQLGNVGIAGHRDTHFRPLRAIRPGDEIVVKARDSTLRYYVDTITIIHPTRMDILDPTDGPTLTLVTCFPFEFIGNAPMRFIVRAVPKPESDSGGASASAGGSPNQSNAIR
jgi:sortase A